MKELFQGCNATLETIQKSLEDFLEKKRRAFPRFYFLSNDELLEILAQRDPSAVQRHLNKCFDNLNRLELSGGGNGAVVDITGMISLEGEVIELGRNLRARGMVEEWLAAVRAATVARVLLCCSLHFVSQVEEHMKSAVSRFIRAGVMDYDNGRRADWVLRNPGQAVACGAQIMWARGTEAAIRSVDPVAALQAWHAKSVSELTELTALVRSHLAPLARMVIVALVTTDVHARDIVETLIADRVADMNNFTWQQQLRYYYDREVDEVTVKQANAVIAYGKEYEVCVSRLKSDCVVVTN